VTNWTLLLSIARKHLITRIKQTAVAAMGVTFGIATFIILISFMTGLNGMLDGLVSNRTPHIRIYNDIKPSAQQPIDLYENAKYSLNAVNSIKPKQSQIRIHNAEAIIANLRKDQLVKGVTPQSMAQVFYAAGSVQLNGRINGINAADEVRLFNFGDYIVKGDAEALEKNSEGILLGAGVAKKLSLDIDDRVQVSNINGDFYTLKIVGIYQSGLAEYDNVQSFTNIKTVQKILGEGSNYITDINVKLYDINLAPPMANRLEKQFNVTATDIQTVSYTHLRAHET